MSIEAMVWVMRGADGRAVEVPNVGGRASAAVVRNVLYVLAEHADPYGRGACPSQQTIAEESGTDRRVVQYVLKALEAANLIVKTAEAVPRQRGATFDLLMEDSAVHTPRSSSDSAEHSAEHSAVDSAEHAPHKPEPEPEPSVTGDTSCPGVAGANAGWDEPWMDVIAQCIEFVGGHNQTRQALIAHARVFAWITANHSAVEAGRALIRATQMIQSRKCGTAAALKAATARLFPTPMAYTDTRKHRTEASLSCPYRFEVHDGKYFLVPKDHPPLEDTPETDPDDLDATSDDGWDGEAPPHEDRDYAPADDAEHEPVEPDVIEHDDGDTWSITSDMSPDEDAARDAQIRREFGLPPIAEHTPEDPEPVEPDADDTRRAELVTEAERLEARVAHWLDRFKHNPERGEKLTGPDRQRAIELRAEIARIDAEHAADDARTLDAPGTATPARGEIPTESRDATSGDGAIPTIHQAKEALNR